MIRITAEQMAAMESAQREHFRVRLVKHIEGKFGRPDAASDLRTSEQAVDAAFEFAVTVGATTQAQIARIAVVLVAVNRQRLSQDKVAQLRAVLLHPDKSPDERIAAAAEFLDITA
jgi:hypothetical protein